jgi:hypothetical protein
MNVLRRHRRFALLLSLWLFATVAAAALSPLFKRADVADMQLLCTVHGIKLVKTADLQPGKADTSSADCPGCLVGLFSGAPVASFHLEPVPLFGGTLQLPVIRFASGEALAATARGPPALH